MAKVRDQLHYDPPSINFVGADNETEMVEILQSFRSDDALVIGCFIGGAGDCMHTSLVDHCSSFLL